MFNIFLDKSMIEYTRVGVIKHMRRAILFLIFALFLAWVIQPNLSNQIIENSNVRTPTQTDSTVITNDTVSNKTSKSKAVICLDAAKGGTETGYTSEGHTSEKDINLQITQKLGESLSNSGYQVVYTRSDDSTVSNESRIQYASEQNAKYFISIQMNSSDNTLSRGYSIFTQSNDKLISLAKQISNNMNTINFTLFEGIDSDHYENFPILYNNSVSSILIELGYLSNSNDYAKLTDENMQTEIASAITSALLKEIN